MSPRKDPALVQAASAQTVGSHFVKIMNTPAQGSSLRRSQQSYGCGRHLEQILQRVGFLHCCCLISVSCLFCDPMDCGLPGSSVHGILQARILEWVAIPFSRGSSPLRGQTSCLPLLASLALQANSLPGKAQAE